LSPGENSVSEESVVAVWLFALDLPVMLTVAAGSSSSCEVNSLPLRRLRRVVLVNANRMESLEKTNDLEAALEHWQPARTAEISVAHRQLGATW